MAPPSTTSQLQYIQISASGSVAKVPYTAA